MVDDDSHHGWRLRAPQKAHGPIAIPRRSPRSSSATSRRYRSRSRTSGEKPREGLCKRLRRLVARGRHSNVVVTAIERELLAVHVGDREGRADAGLTRLVHPVASTSRCGHGIRAILDGVERRLRPTLVPRMRQARDGSQSGGAQPTDLSRINRRHDCPTVSC